MGDHQAFPNFEGQLSSSSLAGKILKLLLEKYEKSKGYQMQDTAPRKIALVPKAIKGLNLEDFSQKEEFLKGIALLKSYGVVDFEWVKFETGNLVKRLWLSPAPEAIERAYGLLGHQVTYMTNEKLTRCLKAYKFTFYEWMQAFQGDVIARFETTGKFGTLLFKEMDLSQNLIQMLIFLDQRCGEAIHERHLSVAIFGDSKAFQKFYKKKLVSLLLSYVDDIDTDHTLAYLGIHTNPETLQFRGNIQLSMRTGVFDASIFPTGATILGRCVSDIETISGSISRVLFIENQASYESALLEAFSETLIVYQGGFSSKAQGHFAEMVVNAFPQAQYFLWSDLDLGGVRILSDLRKQVPCLKPLCMDRATLDRHADQCSSLSYNYEMKVEQAIERAVREDVVEILTVMLQTKKRLEQEFIPISEVIERLETSY